jgi:UDPglucose 6-dehydrogenase
MLRFASVNDYDFQILKAVEDVNDQQKLRLMGKLKKHFGNLKGTRIGVWGLAFKPRTDDMREAPAVPFITALLAAGAKVQAYDPEAMSVGKSIFGTKIVYAETSYDALKGVDALALITEWNEFREPDFERMKKLMKQPVVFDGRNIFKPETLRTQGFTYYSMGRP